MTYRLAYAVFLIQEIQSGNVNILAMYDIACTLDPHLKKRDSILSEKIKFALPAFHAYGHKPSCQVCMSLILYTNSINYKPIGFVWSIIL